MSGPFREASRPHPARGKGTLGTAAIHRADPDALAQRRQAQRGRSLVAANVEALERARGKRRATRTG